MLTSWTETRRSGAGRLVERCQRQRGRQSPRMPKLIGAAYSAPKGIRPRMWRQPHQTAPTGRPSLIYAVACGGVSG